MFNEIWHTLFYDPLFNALVFLIDNIPGGDVGLAVIILTIIVRFILYPLAQKSIVSQAKLRSLEPEIAKIKKEGGTKEEQAKKTMDLYRKNKVNPFSGCLLILIQLPIIFALYKVFLNGLSLEMLAKDLYSFIEAPTKINLNFLGFIDLTGKSIILAVLAAVTQYLQIKLSFKAPEHDPNDKSFKTEMVKSMNVNMKYVLPVFVGFIGYGIAAAVTLYWVTSNVFMIVQEILVARKKKLLELKK